MTEFGSTRGPHYPSDFALARGIDRYPLFEFRLLEKHRALVESHFAETQDAFAKEFDAAWSQLNGEGSDADSESEEVVEDELVERYNLLMDFLPRLQWNAQFLVVYAAFERSLNALCELAQHRSNLSLSYQDMHGSGIVRASTYLRKVVGVESPFTTSAWQSARLLGQVRNAVAHAGGLVASEDSDLLRRMAALNGLRAVADDHEVKKTSIYLSSAFVKEAIQRLSTVLEDVADYELYRPPSLA